VPCRRTSAIANSQLVRCYPGRVLAYAVMKQLLLLTFVAFASEAMAQDAQCVPERAAMVETIRAYARLEAEVLGPQGTAETQIVDAFEEPVTEVEEHGPDSPEPRDEKPS
jgi:hypothetical protein